MMHTGATIFTAQSVIMFHCTDTCVAKSPHAVQIYFTQRVLQLWRQWHRGWPHAFLQMNGSCALTRTIYDDNTGVWLCQLNGRVFRDQCHSKWFSFLHHLIVRNDDGDAYLIWSTAEGHKLRTNSCVVIRSYIEWNRNQRGQIWT